MKNEFKKHKATTNIKMDSASKLAVLSALAAAVQTKLTMLQQAAELLKAKMAALSPDATEKASAKADGGCIRTDLGHRAHMLAGKRVSFVHPLGKGR